MSLGQAFLGALALYVATGLLTGLAFVSIGLERVMSASFSLGARAMLLPASVALWPYVLIRWMRARRAR